MTTPASKTFLCPHCGVMSLHFNIGYIHGYKEPKVVINDLKNKT
jgi:hypothetical protein